MKLNKLTFSLFTLSLALTSGTKAVEAVSLEVIADGLNQPRGFSFSPDGTLYVPEPGIGGNGNCQPSPSTLFQPICAGDTGSITTVTPDGQQQRVLGNFESLAEQPSGNQGAGPSDLQFDDQGNAYLLTGFAGYPGNRDLETLTLGSEFDIPETQLALFPPSPPEEVLNTPSLGQLYQIDLETGELNSIFDFAEAEITLNPDGGDVVSNPYDLTISGDRAYVVDGGGNAAYSIALDGSDFETFALPDLIVTDPVFPPLGPPGEEPGELLPGLFEPVPGRPDQIAIQSVPTGGTIGPDGALSVGEYNGFPYPEGQARIFRIDESGEAEVFADGFSFITDLQFDEEGNLLVLQFSDRAQFEGDFSSLPSSLIQVAPDGTRSTIVAPGEGLTSADGITIDPDGQIYVVNSAIGPGNGEIVRVDDVEGEETPGSAESVPEPASIVGLIAFCVSSGVLFKDKRKKSMDKKTASCTTI
jgi:hypothetical protein